MINYFRRQQFLFMVLCIVRNWILFISATLGVMVRDFTATHWFFPYDYSFIKRGLMDSIYQWLKGVPSLKRISITAGSILFFAQETNPYNCETKAQ